MTGVNRDITERTEHEAKIRYLTTHDALTDLPSLRLVRDRIQMATTNARRNDNKASVLFIDLDGFKNVNDSYGHDTGDAFMYLPRSKGAVKLKQKEFRLFFSGKTCGGPVDDPRFLRKWNIQVSDKTPKPGTQTCQHELRDNLSSLPLPRSQA